MTPFYYCKKAEIHDRSGETVPAQVSIAPTGGLLVTVPRGFQYDPDSPVEIAFYDPIQGIALCRAALSAPLISDDHRSCSYRCRVLEHLAQDQRREDVKIPLSSEIGITLEEAAGKDPLPVPPPEGTASLRNISAGGAYLLSKMDLQVGDRLFFYFHGAGGSIPLTAEILRIDALTDRHNRPINGYGCRFVDLASSYEARLRGYVFQKARQLYS